MARDNAIALYDSGRGVESVVAACRRVLPQEQWLVLQDVKNQPYGTKSDQAIIDIGYACFSQLIAQQVKAIVVACHTSSAIALPHLTQHFSVPAVGMLQPTAQLLAQQYTEAPIIWLATPASVRAGRVERLSRQFGFVGAFYSVACPNWAYLIERNQPQELMQMVTDFAEDHRDLLQISGVKVLYGCTHYPLIDAMMRLVLGDGIETIDPADAVAHVLQSVLAGQGLLTQAHQPGVHFLQNAVDSVVMPQASYVS